MQTQPASPRAGSSGQPGFHHLRAPVKKAERVIRRKRIIRDEAVFPGYLFIQLAPHSDWRALHATRGVSRLVRFNDAPHKIEDGLIAALQQQYSPQQAPAPLV